MARRVRRSMFLVVVLTLAAFVGCGGGAKTKAIAVSGTVTVDGQPLADGVVYFKTVQTGVFETFPVKDGEFKGEALEGERRVEISSFRIKIVDPEGMKSEVKENLIPAKYNVDSTFKETVTRSGPNKFKFELFTK